MKRILVVTLALLLTAGVALAQRGGGPPTGTPPADNGMGRGMGPGGPGGPGGQAGPGAIVAADGTILLPRVVSDSATNTSTMQLVAISAAGAKLWTITLADRGRLELSGNYLLSVSDNTTDVTSKITAISVASGANAWTLTLSGYVHALTPFSGGTYAIVVTPATTAGGTATRTLVAISTSGSVLWKLDV